MGGSQNATANTDCMPPHNNKLFLCRSTTVRYSMKHKFMRILCSMHSNQPFSFFFPLWFYTRIWLEDTTFFFAWPMSFNTCRQHDIWIVLHGFDRMVAQRLPERFNTLTRIMLQQQQQCLVCSNIAAVVMMMTMMICLFSCSPLASVPFARGPIAPY